VEAEPAEGYVFAGWSEDGQVVSEKEYYQFAIKEDKSLVALFEVAVEYKEVDLYFGCQEAIQTGETGEYGYVTPVRSEIADHEDPEILLQLTLEELFKGPDPGEEAFSPVVYDEVEILDLEIGDNRVATINLSEAMFGDQWPGGSLAGNIFIQSITWTSAQFNEVDEVLVLVEGEYWDDGHRIWEEPKAPEKHKKTLPAEIKEWIDYSRHIWLAQEREHDDKLYLLVTFGERPTEGYRVEITGVVEEADRLNVYVKFTEPGDDDPVAQVLTYPYDLKAIDPPNLPVEFVAKGDIEFVPRLANLDWLPPMVAGSEDIRVLSPAPGDTVPREFEVQGIELVFEGTVQYRLLDSAGNELEKGIAVGGHGHKWGHFTVDLAVPEAVESGEELLVELFSESPKDGSVENKVELELLLR